MAVSFVARKCNQCAGKLEYIPEKKVWRCLYCGAEIEREEQYDGMFTIKNVVRQSLLDTANQRLDSAYKNILECEKMDSKYVGTLIANIAYEMIMVTTQGACPEHEVNNYFSQLKKNYSAVKNLSQTISGDEEALYDYMEESDIYALLVLVFDSLNDKSRKSYVESLLNPSEIYSKSLNSNFISYAIKSGNQEYINAISNNTDNLDGRVVLSKLLDDANDSEDKAKNVASVLHANLLKNNDKTIIEDYLTDSDDSAGTKCQIAIAALESNYTVGLDNILNNVLKGSSEKHAKELFDQIFSRKLRDEEVAKLLETAYTNDDYDISVAVFESLEKSNQYVYVPNKLLADFLSKSRFSPKEKATILEKTFKYQFDSKALDGIVNSYLCTDTSPVAERKEIIPILFDKVSNFPTNTLENYILKTNTDAEEKPNVIKAMFDKNLNTSFFGDLLSRYMVCNVDNPAVKQEVINILSSNGLKGDPSSVGNYICDPEVDDATKIEYLKKMLANGTALNASLANEYLTEVLPFKFNADLFGLLITPSSTFTANSVMKYLLYVTDREVNRLSTYDLLISRTNESLSNLRCQITHLDSSLTCNLLQAYTLITKDSQSLAFEVVEGLTKKANIKFNQDVIISGSDSKFKKYILATKDNLSPVTNAICERYKVTSSLF